MPWPLASVLSSLASRAGGGVSENTFQQRVNQYAGTSHAPTARSARGQQEVTRCLPVPVFFRTGVAACLDALTLTAARYVSCHQQNVHAHSTSGRNSPLRCVRKPCRCASVLKSGSNCAAWISNGPALEGTKDEWT